MSVKTSDLTLTRLRAMPPADRFAALEALASRTDSEAQRILTALLVDRTTTIRSQVLNALVEARGPLPLLAARTGLGDPNPEVRSDAADLLRLVGTRQDVPRLLIALEDRDWRVRSSAADALREIRDRRAFEPLARHMATDRHWVVRRDAATALGGLPGADLLLGDALARERATAVRVGLVHGLYIAGDRARLSEWIGFLDHPDSLVVANAINMVFGEDIHPEDRPRAIAALRSLVQQYAHGAMGSCDGIVGK